MFLPRQPHERIIFALDVSTLAEGRELVRLLKDSVGLFKVGMELFTGQGPEVVRMIRAEGGRVFLDLKFHDIPNTVAQAVVQAARLGVEIVDVHATGGGPMMREAVKRLDDACRKEQLARPALIGITVLTSFDETGWRASGHAGDIAGSVTTLAALAQESGLNGVVASPLETAAIRARCGGEFLIVTPGVRPADGAVQDQKRVATPGAAVANGANFLVVGRPIREAADPRAAAAAIARDITEGR